MMAICYRQKLFSSSLLLLSLAACAGSLNSVSAGGQSCTSDAECDGSLCVAGVCVDPAANNLQSVDLEIAPPADSGLLTQSVRNVSTGTDGRTLLQLRSTTTLVGRVTGAEDRGARVTAVAEDGIAGRVQVFSSQTNLDDGTFTLDVVSGDSYRLAVIPNNAQLPPYNRPTRLVVGIQGSAESDLGTFVLPDVETLREVTGRVVAGTGSAALGIPELEVRLQQGPRRVSSVAQTDADGFFKLNLADGQRDNLTLVVRPGPSNALFPSVRLSDLNLENSDDGTDLGEISLGDVAAPVRVQGQVLGPDDVGVGGANVYATADFGVGKISVTTIADVEGSFDFDLPPGTYRLGAVAPVTDPSAGLLAVAETVVAAGVNLAPLRVQARVLTTGNVLTMAQDPAPNTTVRLSRIGPVGGAESPVLGGVSWVFSAITSIDGSFSVDVDPGRYRITAVPVTGSGLPQLTQVVDINTAPAPLDLTLPAAATLVGVVQTPNGSALSAAMVRAFSPFISETGQALLLAEGQSDNAGNFGILLPDLGAALAPSETTAP